ncbi:hypothetical protein G9A89_006905 [Geosiphon pyriformis]|nr:hypothetical protein G9A89_006905 [Geosiphon pyriformis]
MRKKGISLKSSGNTNGIPESSRTQAHLIETGLTKEGEHFVFASSAEQGWIINDINGIHKKIQTKLESTIIMDKHRNIDIVQCEILEMHKIDNQIPDDLEMMQRDSIHIHIPETLISQWRSVREKLRLRKEIEISTDGSLIKAGSNDARGAAAFVTHGIDANFGIAVDRILSSTKTEAKAVLLTLEAVPYKCKLTLNMDSQAVVSTAQKWLTRNSPLSNAIKNVIREKKIDLTINKVTAHTGLTENEMADKLAKEATVLDTMGWAYNNKNISYVPLCEGVELDLDIRHFLGQQTGLQAALD